MRLLFDQNLSPRLVSALEDVFPESLHVREKGLAAADDQTVWDFAADNQLTIVSKDSDFSNLIDLYGFPPQVVWLRLGNCSTKDIARVLGLRAEQLTAFDADAENGIFIIRYDK